MKASIIPQFGDNLKYHMCTKPHVVVEVVVIVVVVVMVLDEEEEETNLEVEFYTFHFVPYKCVCV